jgi:hypothetical protein
MWRKKNIHFLHIVFDFLLDIFRILSTSEIVGGDGDCDGQLN